MKSTIVATRFTVLPSTTLIGSSSWRRPIFRTSSGSLEIDEIARPTLMARNAHGSNPHRRKSG